MNKYISMAIGLALPLGASAQSAIDAFSTSQLDLRGTARFMSMAGAFTALGGDISTLNQNPGGIGVYRSSDVGLTLNLDIASISSKAAGGVDKLKHTTFKVNNFGYVGAVATGNETMPYFNWGVSYSRAASFDRRYFGYLGTIASSYSNLVADYTTVDGYTPNNLGNGDPYYDTYAPWSSVLLYNSGAINPMSSGASSYMGLFNYGNTNPASATSTGVASYEIEEKGHVDEYSIDFGGNIMNTVYWGVGFGITDVDFKQYAYYDERISGANVPEVTTEADFNNRSYYQGGGDAGLSIDNFKHIYGSGFNFKAGVIVKPVNELRFGIAVHTPTYYNLSYEGQAMNYYGYYYDPNVTATPSMVGSYSTPYSDFDWKLNTPWRLMVGAAGVIGGRAIISADYEYRAYSDMKVKDYEGYDWDDVNYDVKTYYKSSNILRLGAEYRLTPGFSLRAGYSYESSPSKCIAPRDGMANYVYTSGPDDTETQPSYTLNRATSYVTFGAGYKYKNFYADLAYVYRHRKAEYHAYTDYNENALSYDANGVASHALITAPSASLSDNNNSLTLTLGIRF